MNDDAYFDHRHVTVIEPARGWRMLDWRELWAYRELLWVLTARDVRVRYKQSVLGAAWALLRPILSTGIFSIIFGSLGHMPSDGVPYPVFVFAGLLLWNLFSTSVSVAAHSLIGSAHLVSKVYFPRLIIPIACLGAPLVDFLVASCLLFVLITWFHIPWTAQLLLMPVLIAVVAAAALGVGTLLSALTVSYRDFTHITPFLIQVWMYLTPVIYPTTLVPNRWRWLIYLNPLTGLVDAFRACVLGRPISWGAAAPSVVVSIALLVLGIVFFQRTERRFADVI